MELHETIEQRKCTVLKMDPQPTGTMNETLSEGSFTAVKDDWPEAFDCSKLEAVDHRDIAELSKIFQGIIFIGSHVRLT